MSTNSTHEFPAPVGGVPAALDFAPSILFAVLYALLFPVVVWRMVHPRSRNTVLIGTSFFSIERIVSFSLRAKAAIDPEFRTSEGILTYIQTIYSSGFITIGQDLVNLLRALLVASTLGGDMVAQHKLTPPHIRKATKQMGSEVELASRGQATEEGVYEVNDAGDAASSSGSQFADQTKLRKTIRGWLGLAMALFLVAIFASAIGGGNYKMAVDGGGGALVRFLWDAATVLTIVLLVAAALTALFAWYKLPRVPRSSALLIVLVACLLCIIAIYRLIVLSHSTTSLFSTAPGAQNSTTDKAAFYVLHAAPEFLSIALLLSLNARRVFGTGPMGDIRFRDPKPKAKPAAK